MLLRKLKSTSLVRSPLPASVAAIAISVATAACESNVSTNCVDVNSPDCQLLQEAAGDAPVLEETSTLGENANELGVTTSLPAGITNTTIFKINLSGQGYRGFRFKVGPAASMDCNAEEGYSNPTMVTENMSFDVSSLADGELAACLMTMDEAGNWKPLEEVVASTWEKDTIAPEGSISGMPSGSSASTDLDVTIGTAGGVDKYAYKVGPASSTDCDAATGYSAPVSATQKLSTSIASIPDGSVKLCVKTWDKAGNQNSGSFASSTWTKDTTSSSATLTGAPNSQSNSTSVSVTVGGTDVVAYKYLFGPSSSTDCAGSYGDTEIPVSTPITESLAALPDGEYKICILSIDSTGNIQSTPTSYVWTKDTDAPDVAISGQPSGIANTTLLAVSVDPDTADYYKYKVGPASSTDCSVAGGYIGPVLASMPITTDISGEADGTMKLCVIAQDTAGNWQSEADAEEVTWTKDTASPGTISISGMPTGSSNDSSFTLSVPASGGVTAYRYKFGPGTSSICSDSSGYSATEIAAGTDSSISIPSTDGSYTVCVIARDASGNWVPVDSATSSTWTRDSDAPGSVSFSGGPSGTSNSTSINLDVPAAGGITGYRYKAVSGSDCSSDSGYSAEIAAATDSTVDVSSLPDGTVTLCVIARDSAGNWMPAGDASESTWTKDTTAPASASFSGGPSGTSNSTTMTLDVPAAGGVTGYKYKVVSGTDCSSDAGYSAEVASGTDSPIDFAAVADGTVTLCVIARDSAGNWMAAADASTTTWTKDTTAVGSVSFSGGPSGSSNSTTFSLDVPATGGVTAYKYKVVSGSDCSSDTGYSAEIAAGTDSAVDYSDLADGAVTLCVIAKDENGNWMAAGDASTSSWTKDTTAPASVSFSGAPTGTSSSSTFTLAVPPATGMAAYKYKAVAGSDCSDTSGYSAEVTAGTDSTVDVSSLADGTVTLCVIGRDEAGNWMAAGDASIASWTKGSGGGGSSGGSSSGGGGDAPTTFNISGAPSGTTSLDTLTINVPASGGTIQSYRYDVVEGTDCTNESGYSSSIPAGTATTVDLETLPDGELSLCIIAQGSNGTWMTTQNAIVNTWTRNTTPPTVTCNAGQYPVSGSCTNVGTGYYSNDGVFRNACSNSLPTNASWTSSASTTAICPWFCNAGYTGSSSNGDTACAAVSGAGVLVPVGSAVDDTSYVMNPCTVGSAGCANTGFPFPFSFMGTDYGNAQNGGIHFSSNNYINFGFGSPVYSGFSASHPGRGIYLNAADNMVTFLYLTTGVVNGINQFNLTYEGYQYGQPPSTYKNIKLEFYGMATSGQALPQSAGKCYYPTTAGSTYSEFIGNWTNCYQVINVLYGSQFNITGVSKITNGSAYVTVNGLGTEGTYSSSGSGPYTVTVTSPVHGLTTGQSITVAKAENANAQGTYTITRLTADTFTYSATSNPSTGSLYYTVAPYTTGDTTPVGANYSFSLGSDATGTHWTKLPYIYHPIDGFVKP